MITVTHLISLCVIAGEADSKLYAERYRPQFHFTADQGWLNDPNGLVFVDGVYHLFFQHDRPNTRWGHATSTDLLHWKQQPDAIVPRNGHLVFSGSAVVDKNNTSGLATTGNAPIVAIFTSWGEGQCLAYSNDAGKTWTRYKNNPVLKLPGDHFKSWQLSSRDPHVSWNKQQKRWVMVLYNNPDQRPDKKGSGFSFFSSPDLKNWTQQSHLPGFYVCPDVFQLPVDGEPGTTSWVAMDWSQYTTGHFDGSTFKSDAPIRKLDYGSHLSANQSWKYLPDGRVVQICWLRGGKYPGMPFNQQLSFPTELSLRRIDNQLLLCKNPIREISRLHRNTKSHSSRTLKQGQPLKFKGLTQSLDINATFTLQEKGELVIDVLGEEVRITRNVVRCMGKTGNLPATPAKQDIRILADRTSLEIFANGGSMTMAFCLLPADIESTVTIRAEKGMNQIHKLSVRDVASIWDAVGKRDTKQGTKRGHH